MSIEEGFIAVNCSCVGEGGEKDGNDLDINAVVGKIARDGERVCDC